MTHDENLEHLKQLHEPWLGQLEGLAIQAIATKDWTAFYAHVVDFQNKHDKAVEDEDFTNSF